MDFLFDEQLLLSKEKVPLCTNLEIEKNVTAKTPISKELT